MKYIDKKIKRIAMLDCYIPLQLKTKEEFLTDEYLFFRKENHSLLEIGYAQNSIIHSITLLICKEYKEIPHLYAIPKDYKDGDVLIDNSKEINTDIFYCEIYLNAVKIIVSNNEVNEIIKSDNVIWELDNNNTLVSICVLDSLGKISYNCLDVLNTNAFN